MIKTFKQMEDYILSNHIVKKVVVAGAHDKDCLTSVVAAKNKGIITPILLGHSNEIKAILQELGETPDNYEIIEIKDDMDITNTACQMVADGKGDIPMKGLVQTSAFMRAVLNKERGFVPDKGLLSQATVVEYPAQDRLVIISDCAINIAPDYEAKTKIIANAVKLANALGEELPKVAVIAPLENVNLAVPSTVEAALLSKAADRGQIKGCIVDGPLALDNAVSVEAAEHKGIKSPVAGIADILIMPDLAAGNIFTKSLTYFANLPSSGTVTGTTRPVIMTSRTDSPENKYYSILTAIFQSL